MGTDLESIRNLLKPLVHTWMKIEPVKDVVDSFANLSFSGPLETAFRCSDENMQICLKVSHEYQYFMNRSSPWKSSTDVLEKATEASVGRNAANAQALIKLQELQSFFRDSIESGKMGKILSEAVFQNTSYLKSPEDILSSNVGFNAIALHEVLTRFDAGIYVAEKAVRLLDEATTLLLRMSATVRNVP